MSYHTIIIVGYLGRDPEMRYVPSGQAVTNFNMATSRRYTGPDGQQVDETTWFRISVWGKQAESCNQYLKKGSLVLVEGRLNPDPKTGSPRIWQGQNGPGASFEVTANTVRFLGKSGDGGGGGGGGYRADESFNAEPSDDGIPF